jgi:ATP synthase protein I
MRVGAELVAALLVGFAIGWGLDHVFGTRPIFMGLFLLVGGAAGMLNVWRLVAPRP